MKASELRKICDLLEGYSDDARFEVLAATKTEDGRWQLTVKKVEPETEEPKERADDNQ